MPQLFQCPATQECGYAASSKKKLLKHVCRLHKRKHRGFGPYPRSLTGKLFDCPVKDCCDGIGFNLLQLEAHLKKTILGDRERRTALLLRQESHYAVGYRTTSRQFSNSMRLQYVPFLVKYHINVQPLVCSNFKNPLKPWKKDFFIGICSKQHVPEVNSTQPAHMDTDNELPEHTPVPSDLVSTSGPSAPGPESDEAPVPTPRPAAPAIEVSEHTTSKTTVPDPTLAPENDGVPPPLDTGTPISMRPPPEDFPRGPGPETSSDDTIDTDALFTSTDIDSDS